MNRKKPPVPPGQAAGTGISSDNALQAHMPDATYVTTPCPLRQVGPKHSARWQARCFVRAGVARFDASHSVQSKQASSEPLWSSVQEVIVLTATVVVMPSHLAGHFVQEEPHD